MTHKQPFFNKMSYNKEFGARLKEARKKCGLTQEKIAQKFDIDKSSVSKYESGDNTPGIEYLKEFAEYLNINGDWLLFGKPPIFKSSEINRDIEGLFLEFLAGIKEADSESPPTDYLTGDLKHSLDRLTEDSPDNYFLLLDYMAKHPTARRDIFKYFHIFIKPAIDGPREMPG